MSDTSPNIFQGGDVLITGGNFLHQTNVYMKEDPFNRLQQRVAPAAMHDSGEPFEKPKCHKNTRVAVLSRLMYWILGKHEEDKLIMWLHGDAGAGKSAIAQTLALRCASDRHLLASFAFSRTDRTRSTHTSLASTIAYQMAAIVPGLRTLITACVERDPIVFEKSLQVQFTSLIINPINGLCCSPDFIPNSIPRLIIIDGLDECSDHRIQIRIIEVLLEAAKECDGKLKILIASRADVDISMTFNNVPTASISTRLALDASFKPDDDIRLALESAFHDIKAGHRSSSSIPTTWPEQATITQLVMKASGQFIYASTVAKYISSPRHHPVERLEIVLGIRPPASDQDLPFATLDSLFTHIFSSVHAEYTEAVFDILACQIYAPQSLRPYLILPLLSLDEHKVALYLGDLSSILKWEVLDDVYDELYEIYDFWNTDVCFEEFEFPDQLQTLEFAHASVADFLSDHQRSKKFYIDKEDFLSKLACMCLGHLNRPRTTTKEGLFRYCWSNLNDLLGNLTPALRDNLLIFTLSKLPEDPPFTFKFVVEFMCALRKQEDAQYIYAHHLAEFDQYILSSMKKQHMFTDIGLRMALLGLSHNPTCRRIWVHWKEGILGTDLFSCSQEGVLVDFFDNPLRSREFVRTGATYAAAALRGFNDILSKYIPRSIINGIPMSIMELSKLSKEEVALKSIVFLNAVCHYLHQLLDRASHSTRLIAIIQSGKFQSTYGQNIFPPECSRVSDKYNRAVIAKVVQAAEAYLERTASLDSMQGDVDMRLTK